MALKTAKRCHRWTLTRAPSLRLLTAQHLDETERRFERPCVVPADRMPTVTTVNMALRLCRSLYCKFRTAAPSPQERRAARDHLLMRSCPVPGHCSRRIESGATL